MGDAEFIVRVNAVGTVNIAREYLRIAEEGDALVNVASIAGHMIPQALQPTRTYAKALTDVDAFAAKLVKGTRTRSPPCWPSPWGATQGTSPAPTSSSTAPTRPSWESKS